jgi:hypothetical protein
LWVGSGLHEKAASDQRYEWRADHESAACVVDLSFVVYRLSK